MPKSSGRIEVFRFRSNSHASPLTRGCKVSFRWYWLKKGPAQPWARDRSDSPAWPNLARSFPQTRRCVHSARPYFSVRFMAIRKKNPAAYAPKKHHCEAQRCPPWVLFRLSPSNSLRIICNTSLIELVPISHGDIGGVEIFIDSSKRSRIASVVSGPANPIEGRVRRL